MIKRIPELLMGLALIATIIGIVNQGTIAGTLDALIAAVYFVGSVLSYLILNTKQGE